MKVMSKRNLVDANLEVVTIEIEFNPNNVDEEGYVAMIGTVCDTVRRIITLERALDDYENDSLLAD